MRRISDLGVERDVWLFVPFGIALLAMVALAWPWARAQTLEGSRVRLEARVSERASIVAELHAFRRQGAFERIRDLQARIEPLLPLDGSALAAEAAIEEAARLSGVELTRLVVGPAAPREDNRAVLPLGQRVVELAGYAQPERLEDLRRRVTQLLGPIEPIELVLSVPSQTDRAEENGGTFEFRLVARLVHRWNT